MYYDNFFVMPVLPMDANYLRLVNYWYFKRLVKELARDQKEPICVLGCMGKKKSTCD